MSEMTFKNQQFWTEFIELYRSLPAVWNVTSKEYSNRILKTAAYRKLVKKLKEIEPDANRDSAVRKINVLRTNYRRDVKKIKLYQSAGEEYTSNFWYFNLLHSFLNKDLVSRNDSIASWSSSNLKEEDDIDIDQVEEVLDMDDIEQKPLLNQLQLEEQQQQQQIEEANVEIMDNDIEEEEAEATYDNDDKQHVTSINNIDDEEIEIPMCSISGLPLPTTTKRGRISYNEDTSAGTPKSIFVETNHRSCKNVAFTPKQSEASLSIAKSWATQYEEISPKQRIIARKMISDILFFGCLGQLNEQHASDLQDVVNNALPGQSRFHKKKKS